MFLSLDLFFINNSLFFMQSFLGYPNFKQPNFGLNILSKYFYHNQIGKNNVIFQNDMALVVMKIT